MKSSYLVGTLLFLAIVNIVAVDTWLYYKFVHGPSEPAVTATATTGVRGGVSKLDPAQRKEIARIKREYRDATRDLYARITELEDEMYGMVQEDPLPRERIERNLTEHGDLRLRLKRIAIEKMVETRSILNPEQKAELFKAIFRTPGRQAPDSLAGGRPMK